MSWPLMSRSHGGAGTPAPGWLAERIGRGRRRAIPQSRRWHLRCRAVQSRTHVLPGPGARAFAVPSRPTSRRTRSGLGQHNTGALVTTAGLTSSSPAACRRSLRLRLAHFRSVRRRGCARFEGTGFRDVQTTTEAQRFVLPSVEAFFGPFERGGGSSGQAYLTLPEAERRDVREEVKRNV